jgi:hypothetical protein
MRQGDAPELVGKRFEVGIDAARQLGHTKLAEEVFCDGVEQAFLTGDVVIQALGVDAEESADRAHADRGDSVAVDHRKSRIPNRAP